MKQFKIYNTIDRWGMFDWIKQGWIGFGKLILTSNKITPFVLKIYEE